MATATQTTRRMAALRMNGVAGVRRAANRGQLGAAGDLVDGWAVLKQADGTPLKEAPVAATQTATPTAEERAEKAEADLVAANERVAELEAAVAAAPEGPAPTADEVVAKAMEKLDPAVRAHFESVQKSADETAARAVEAEKVAKAEQNIRIDGEWVAIARSEFTRLGTEAETFGPVLRAAYETFTPEQFNELHRVLRSHEALAEKSDAFRPVGSGSTVAAGAWSQIQKAADDLRVAHPELTPEAAIDQAVVLNPALKAAYDKERNA